VIRGYVGEGSFTSDALNTFGGVGVVQIAELQKLLHYICENGFEHHVAANFSTTAAAVHEAAVATWIPDALARQLVSADTWKRRGRAAPRIRL